MSHMLRRLAASVGILLLPQAVEGQHVAWIRQGPPSVGLEQVVVPDQNGDAEADIAALVGIQDPVSLAWHNEIWFISGADGSWLSIQMQPPPGDSYYRLWPLGDTNGDGHIDFLVSGWIRGIPGIHALSGLSLRPLYRVQAPPYVPFSHWGASVVGGLDIDNNGLTDTVVTDDALGIVYVYDHTGAEIYRTSSAPGTTWQYAGAFEDHNGDGHDDFLITAFDWATALTGAEIISGGTGQPMFRVLGQPGDYLDKVTGCGDLDGDGKMDILLGGGNFAPGTVQAFSSVTGQRIWAWYSGWSGDLFGQFMLGTVDIDQDGIADPIATSLSQPAYPGGPRGYVSIFNGRDGTETRFSDSAGQTSSSDFGLLTAVPPRAGSSLPRFVVSAYRWGQNPVTFNSISRTYMFEAGPEGAETVGPACVGTLQAEPRMGLRQIAANQSRVILSGAEPGMLALLVLGLATAPQPVQLTPFGFAGCELHPTICEIGAVFPGSSGTDAGYAFHDFQLDFVAPSISAMTVVGQFVVLGSAQNWPGGTSQALRWHFH